MTLFLQHSHNDNQNAKNISFNTQLLCLHPHGAILLVVSLSCQRMT